MAIKKIIDTSAQSVTFDFGDRRDSIVVALSALTPETVVHAALHGLSQKLGDSYAGAKDAVKEDPNLTPEAYAAECVSSVWEQLVAGNWKAVARTGTGGPRVTLLAEALSRAAGIDVADAVDKLAALTDDEQKAIKSNAVVKAHMDVIRAERAAERAAAAQKAAAGQTFNI